MLHASTASRHCLKVCPLKRLGLPACCHICPQIKGARRGVTQVSTMLKIRVAMASKAALAAAALTYTPQHSTAPQRSQDMARPVQLGHCMPFSRDHAHMLVLQLLEAA